MRIIAILTGLFLLTAMLVSCGGDDAVPEPVGSPVIAEPSATEIAPANTAPPQPTPTSFAGAIPSPIVVAATSTAVPTATAEAAGEPADNSTNEQATPAASSSVMASATATPASGEASFTSEPRDCGDFATHREAQLFFLEEGGPIDDPLELDTDFDGIACNAETDNGYDRITFALFGAPTSTPLPTATASAPRQNCDSFDTWQEAYDFFISQGGPDSDPHGLDTDGDGVPCGRLKFLEENPPTPTPTMPPAEPATGVWSSPERTAELNSINWPAFKGAASTVWGNDYYGSGVSKIAAEGELVRTFWLDAGNNEIEVDCGPRFGNRLDKDNPSYDGRRNTRYEVWIWIEPSDGGAPYCAKVDMLHNWLPSDPEPLPPLHESNARDLPKAELEEPLVFTDPVNGPRFHTLPPSIKDIQDPFNHIGLSWDVLEGEFECDPRKVPLATWTYRMGFEVLGREEEEHLALHSSLVERIIDMGRDKSDRAQREEFWRSYDWEAKEFWRKAGWYLVINPSIGYSGLSFSKDWDARNEDPIHFIAYESSCWRVPNSADIPPPRYCLHCERYRNWIRLRE